MDFCTYITFYKGNKMPPFYIGYTSIKNISENGYHGSASSIKYGKIWKSEIRNNKGLFKTIILTKHETRKDAIEKENYLQTFFKVHKNPMYINMAIQNERFYCSGPHSEKTKEKISKSNKGKIVSDETKKKMSKSNKGKIKTDLHCKNISKRKQSKEWKETTGKEAARKSSEIQNDPLWKSTVGKLKIEKDLLKKYDPLWKETIGKQGKEKELKTKSDPIWLKEIGNNAYKRMSDTKQSDEWKSTIGKTAGDKLSKTQKSDEWKLIHWKTCETCGKGPMSPGNYSKWHGNNCRISSQ